MRHMANLRWESCAMLSGLLWTPSIQSKTHNGPTCKSGSDSAHQARKSGLRSGDVDENRPMIPCDGQVAVSLCRRRSGPRVSHPSARFITEDLAEKCQCTVGMTF